MNTTANIVSSQSAPIADRNAGPANTNSEDDASQVRFAEVLRGKQARTADDNGGARKAKGEPAAGAKEDEATSSTPATGTDGSAATVATPALPPAATDPAIAALLLDPNRVPASRLAPVGLGGPAAAKAGATGPADADANFTASPAIVNAADSQIPLASLPASGNAVSVPGTPGVAAGGTPNAAAGVRAETRPGAIQLPAGFEAARDTSPTNRAQLPFGMAADSALRSEAPAIETTRPDAAGWAAFAVPVDNMASRQAAPAPLPPIEAPVGSPRFADETAQQVTWLVKNGLSEAEIRVKPVDMGPISVRIEMNQNEATLSFAVTQPETRAAVQDSLHRLTEMLAESGISLGEASVGGQNFTQQSRDGGNSPRSRVTFAPGRGDDAPAGATGVRHIGSAASRGLVDTFA